MELIVKKYNIYPSDSSPKNLERLWILIELERVIINKKTSDSYSNPRCVVCPNESWVNIAVTSTDVAQLNGVDNFRHDDAGVV